MSCLVRRISLVSLIHGLWALAAPFVVQYSTGETHTSSRDYRSTTLADVRTAQRTWSSPVSGYAHGPFFIVPSQVERKQLVVEVIFIALLFALIVNIPWRRRKDDRE
jgi:hypothetical protein